MSIIDIYHDCIRYLLKGLFAGYLMMQLVEQVIGRKRADAHQSSERTRAQITLHSISDAVIGTDMQGVVDYLNPAAERIFGFLGTALVMRSPTTPRRRESLR